MDKTDLRNHYIEVRRDLEEHSLFAKNESIRSRFPGLVDWRIVSTVHAYQSINDWKEVDTEWIQDFFDTEHPHISLTYGSSNRGSLIPEQSFDVVIVPLLAFDKHGNRLGFGGGWYDRFLAGQTGCIKIGLAFEEQKAEQLPVEPHDIRLDVLVTDQKVRNFS